MPGPYYAAISIQYNTYTPSNPMLRNALQRSNLAPSVSFTCHFCARRLPLSCRYLSTTLPAYKSRSSKRVEADLTEDIKETDLLTELRKDIKETVARKNEAKESRRWRQRAKSDAHPATADAAAVASEGHTENRRRRREKLKIDKAIRKASDKKTSEKKTSEKKASDVSHEKAKTEREKGGGGGGGGGGKREKLPKNVAIRRMNGKTPVSVTPKDKAKEMGGVSLATALSRRPLQKNMLTMDPENDTVKRTSPLTAEISIPFYSIQRC